MTNRIPWGPDSPDYEKGCPVPAGHDCTVWSRDGGLARDNAPEGWSWEHLGDGADIIAYCDHDAPDQARELLAEVWQQAKENHARYSATGDREQDIRFFGLGLAGEAGEVANFIKKRWRDGDGHDADLRAECADVLAYTIMLADALGMTADDLLNEVARKQQVFIAKMQARDLKGTS